MPPSPELFPSTFSGVCYYECPKAITKPESWLRKPEFDLYCNQQDKSGLHSQYTFPGSSLLLKERWSRSSLHFIHSLMNSLKKQKIKKTIMTCVRAHEPKFTPLYSLQGIICQEIAFRYVGSRGWLNILHPLMLFCFAWDASVLIRLTSRHD